MVIILQFLLSPFANDNSFICNNFQCLHLPEVVELLDISDRHAFHRKENQLQDHGCQHPFVVVEGMDATGRYHKNSKNWDIYKNDHTCS